MAYVATNYKTNPAAPLNDWVCTRGSGIGPSTTKPDDTSHYPSFCGQCVSFVTTVCVAIPVNTGAWTKGKQVKGNTDVLKGTAIATFDANGKYKGHAAVYDGQTAQGINVYDQWVTGDGQAISPRLLKFGAPKVSNNGDLFYVVE